MTVPDHQEDWHQSAWRAELRRRLARWFRRNSRDLPWRADPEPYKVWVSEIMCQQTQIATVLPYFQRFLQSFPTIAALANTDEQTLLKHWEGLGYYRRARSLQAAAKQIVEQHDGVFPERFDDVIALPGIGRYTAGAILSISKDQRHPILEGNTQRVFSRWIALRDDPTQSAATRLLWKVSEAMLPRKGTGTFNQAAMELGALVCTPKQPACDRCPVRTKCAAHRLGLEHEIPAARRRLAYRNRTEYALVVGDPSRGYLIRPLSDGGRWAGLWDFPRTHEVEAQSAADAGHWLSSELATPIAVGERFKTFKHAVTRYRISLHVHDATINGNSIGELPAPWRFASLHDLEQLPMSMTGRKIVKLLSSDT